MTKPIDRAALKAQARELLQTAQVSPKGMTALYCICLFLFSLMEALFPGPELVSTFLSILTTLAGWILAAGFALYCMDIRRRERSEYAVLFDGFSFTGKIIALNIVINLFVFLWSMMVGIDMDGAVTGVSIISNSETSGIGSKVMNNETLTSGANAGQGVLEQFIGKSAADGVLSVGSNVDAITGATVSTKGVTTGVNAALAAAGVIG